MRRSGAVIFCCLQSKRCMHAGRAAPNGANFPKGKFQSFLPYFLYFTKSRKKFPKGTSLAACRQRSREAAKDLILPQRSRHCGELNRGLENLDVPGKGNGFILFACTKRTKSTPKGCDPLDSRGRFKALSKKILAEFSNGTSRNRLFAQNGGEKALNRCEVRALQRKELERTSKE